MSSCCTHMWRTWSEYQRVSCVSWPWTNSLQSLSMQREPRHHSWSCFTPTMRELVSISMLLCFWGTSQGTWAFLCKVMYVFLPKFAISQIHSHWVNFHPIFLCTFSICAWKKSDWKCIKKRNECSYVKRIRKRWCFDRHKMWVQSSKETNHEMHEAFDLNVHWSLTSTGETKYSGREKHQIWI